MFKFTSNIMCTPKTYFARLFVRAGTPCEKAPHVQKPQFFLGFSRFLTCTRMAHELKKGQTIGPRAFRTQLPTKIVQKIRPGALWARFWRVLGRFWKPSARPFGVSWELLGVSWSLLNTSWTHLGRPLAGLGPHFGSWGGSAMDFESLWEGPKNDFEAPGAYFSMFF